MSLGDWKKNGWLVEHSTSPREIADILSDHEAGEMLSLAEKLRALVLAWLRQDHPDLLP